MEGNSGPDPHDWGRRGEWHYGGNSGSSDGWEHRGWEHGSSSGSSDGWAHGGWEHGGWGGGDWEGGRWKWQSNWDDNTWEYIPDPQQVMTPPATTEKKRQKPDGKALLETLLGDGATSSSVVSRLSAIEEEEASSSAVSRLSAAEEGKSKGKGKGKNNVDPDDNIIWVRREFADMKCPNCDGCGNAVSYKLQQFTDEKLEETDGGIEIWHRLYHCAECMAKKWDCSTGEAQARIITDKPHHKRRVIRAQKFKEADERIAQEFQAFGTKKQAPPHHSGDDV